MVKVQDSDGDEIDSYLEGGEVNLHRSSPGAEHHMKSYIVAKAIFIVLNQRMHVMLLFRSWQ